MERKIAFAAGWRMRRPLSEIKSLFCQLAWLFVVGGYKTQGVFH